MQGVIYLLIGDGHSLYLTVSLHSLRKYYRGPVTIMTTEPEGIAAKIADDPRLVAQWDIAQPITPIKLCQQRRNSALCTKTAIHRYTPFQQSIFLDADTIVAGDPTSMFCLAKTGSVVLTKFSDWKLASSPYRHRCGRFAAAADCTSLFHERLLANDDCINTGVFAFRKDADLLEEVHLLTIRAPRVFIPDECAMQLLYMKYPHTVIDDRYNCSPVHGRHKDEVVIWHCHGSKVLRPAVRSLWLGLLKECWVGNVGNVRDWIRPEDRERFIPMIGG